MTISKGFEAEPRSWHRISPSPFNLFQELREVRQKHIGILTAHILNPVRAGDVYLHSASCPDSLTAKINHASTFPTIIMGQILASDLGQKLWISRIFQTEPHFCGDWGLDNLRGI